MSEEQFIDEWSRSLWKIESLDDVYKHAAIMASEGMNRCNLDGLGRLGTDSGCDTRFNETSTEIESIVID